MHSNSQWNRHKTTYIFILAFKVATMDSASDENKLTNPTTQVQNPKYTHTPPPAPTAQTHSMSAFNKPHTSGFVLSDCFNLLMCFGSWWLPMLGPSDCCRLYCCHTTEVSPITYLPWAGITQTTSCQLHTMTHRRTGMDTHMDTHTHTHIDAHRVADPCTHPEKASLPLTNTNTHTHTHTVFCTHNLHSV